MEDKIKIANELLKIKSIKAIKLKKINITNLIFSLNNVEKHYITPINRTTWYCYKVYDCGLPKTESDIQEYCSCDNLHRSLHDNDYNRRIRLVSGTEDSIDALINYLKMELGTKLYHIDEPNGEYDGKN